MTSGRDEAKKRRGRGKAEEGPTDESFDWLAELRNAGPAGEGELGAFGGTAPTTDPLDQVNPRRAPGRPDDYARPDAAPRSRADIPAPRESASGSRPAVPPPSSAPEPTQAWSVPREGRDRGRGGREVAAAPPPPPAQGGGEPPKRAWSLKELSENAESARAATPPPADAARPWAAPSDAAPRIDGGPRNDAGRNGGRGDGGPGDGGRGARGRAGRGGREPKQEWQAPWRAEREAAARAQQPSAPPPRSGPPGSPAPAGSPHSGAPGSFPAAAQEAPSQDWRTLRDAVRESPSGSRPAGRESTSGSRPAVPSQPMPPQSAPPPFASPPPAGRAVPPPPPAGRGAASPPLAGRGAASPPVPPQQGGRTQVPAAPEPTQAWNAPRDARDGGRESSSGSRPAHPDEAWRESPSQGRRAAREDAAAWEAAGGGRRRAPDEAFESPSGSRRREQEAFESPSGSRRAAHSADREPMGGQPTGGPPMAGPPMAGPPMAGQSMGGPPMAGAAGGRRHGVEPDERTGGDPRGPQRPGHPIGPGQPGGPNQGQGGRGGPGGRSGRGTGPERPSPFGPGRSPGGRFPGDGPPAGKPFVDLARFDPNPVTYRGTASSPAAIDWEQTQIAPFGLLQHSQIKRVRQLRMATIIFVVLAVVLAPAAFFAIRELSRDPVFVELDDLNLPEWAARNPTDGAVGSRWCIGECRSRQRTWESARGPDETNRAFVGKLRDAGWVEWNIPDCQAEGVDGIETCWQRDEYVLDLWVRAAVCEVKPARPRADPVPGASAGKTPSGKPTGRAPASSAAAPPPTADAQPSEIPAPAICPLAITTIKVFNRISYEPGSGQPGP